MARKFSNPAKTYHARDILQACAVERGADFHRLASEQVDALLIHADLVKYRKPRGANGSRGRYFHDMLQRRARGVTVDDARRAFPGRLPLDI